MTALGKVLVHAVSALALGVVAFAFGRWLRDPEPGGPLIALLIVAGTVTVALRQLYAPPPDKRDSPLSPPPDKRDSPLSPPPDKRDSPLSPPRDSGDSPLSLTPGLLEVLNGGGVEDLQRLPGVGPVVAGRIVSARPFAAVDDLRRVPGFGPARVEVLRRSDRAGASRSSGAPAGPRAPGARR